MGDRLQGALGARYEQLDVGNPDGHGMSAAILGGAVNKRRNLRLYVFLRRQEETAEDGDAEGKSYFFDDVSGVAVSKRATWRANKPTGLFDQVGATAPSDLSPSGGSPPAAQAPVYTPLLIPVPPLPPAGGG